MGWLRSRRLHVSALKECKVCNSVNLNFTVYDRGEPSRLNDAPRKTSTELIAKKRYTACHLLLYACCRKISSCEISPPLHTGSFGVYLKESNLMKSNIVLLLSLKLAEVIKITSLCSFVFQNAKLEENHTQLEEEEHKTIS